MKRISQEAYKKYFELSDDDNQNSKKTKYEKALEYAIETRKLEIQMYWERAKYFWTFVAAVFVAYGVIQKFSNGNEKIFFSILMCCLGFFLSFAWYCVNRGSKQWQENWENHVAMLEDKVIGPLFKTVLTRDESQKKLFRDFFLGPAPFSVSKVNQLVSVYLTVFWLVLLIYSAQITFSLYIHILYFLPIFMTFLACFFMFFHARSDFNNKNDKHDHIHSARIFKVKIKPAKDIDSKNINN